MCVSLCVCLPLSPYLCVLHSVIQLKMEYTFPLPKGGKVLAEQPYKEVDLRKLEELSVES